MLRLQRTVSRDTQLYHAAESYQEPVLVVRQPQVGPQAGPSPGLFYVLLLLHYRCRFLLLCAFKLVQGRLLQST